MAKSSQVRRILHAVISLEISKGHMRWTIAELARKVRVSRPLIYYHFGKTKQTILEKSLDIVAEDFFGLSDERVEMLKSGHAVKSLLLSRQMVLAEPSFAQFYSKWRMTKSSLQKRLLIYEARYQAMLGEHFPHLKPHEVKALHGIFYAVVTAPFLDEASIKSILRIVNKLTQST